jgi:peptide/nickel transport system substrate-binding protein
MMSMWSGIDNGVPTADMKPDDARADADDQLQWPVWGMHYCRTASEGEAPGYAGEAAELVRSARTAWKKSPDRMRSAPRSGTAC